MLTSTRYAVSVATAATVTALVATDRNWWVAWLKTYNPPTTIKEPEMIKLCQWDITGNCNLNCTYCREKSTKMIPDMPIGQIRSIIDKITGQVKMVSLAGGEPMVFRYLQELLEYLKGKVEVIGLTTNATLISERNIDMIKEYIDGVQVSLDGSSATVHDNFRGQGTFDKAVTAIELMRRHGILVMTRFTMTEGNINDVGSYVRLAHSLGLDRAYIRRVIPVGNGASARPLSPRELYRAYSEAFAVGRELGIHIGSTDYFSQLEFDPKERAKAEKNLAEKPDRIISGCSMGTDAFYLSQNGQILFCPYLPIYCGDLTKQTLGEIWREAKMFRINRSLRRNVKGKCTSCKFLNCCGGCPAYIYHTTGDICESDNGCWRS